MNIATPDDRTEVIDFDQWVERYDAGRFVWDVATNRLPNTSEGQRRRIQRIQQEKSSANLQHREVLRRIFAELQADGWVREPTRIEKLRTTAAGHEDNASVQAARRLLARLEQQEAG